MTESVSYIFKRPAPRKDRPFRKSTKAMTGVYVAQKHYSANIPQEINLAAFPRQLIVDRSSFDGGTRFHTARRVHLEDSRQKARDVSLGATNGDSADTENGSMRPLVRRTTNKAALTERRINVDRVSINGVVGLSKPAINAISGIKSRRHHFKTDSFLRKGSCDERDTTELVQNGVQPSVMAVGAAFYPDAPALATKAIRTMAAVALASAKNGWIMMCSQIGAMQTAWRKVCKLTALIMTVTTNQAIAAGQLRKYKTTIVEQSNGWSLMACDLRNETGPNASELQRVVYGIGSNIGLWKKHSPYLDNWGRKCNRCFRYLDCFDVGLAHYRRFNRASRADIQSGPSIKAVYLSSQLDRILGLNKAKSAPSDADIYAPCPVGVCRIDWAAQLTQTKQGGCLYEQPIVQETEQKSRRVRRLNQDSGPVMARHEQRTLAMGIRHGQSRRCEVNL